MGQVKEGLVLKHIWLAAALLLGREWGSDAAVLDLGLFPCVFPAYAGSGEGGFAAACGHSACRRSLWSMAAAGSSKVPALQWICSPVSK